MQPKASVAANTGTGPDLFWGLYSLPHLFPQEIRDQMSPTISARNTQGGTGAVTYGKSGNKWIAIPICYSGNMMSSRRSLDGPATSRSSDKTDGFLEYAKAMKKNNTPGGFALGSASGDGNGWVHWCLWSQGGDPVDKDDKVIINWPETAKALEYAKALYAEMIPGVASWNDASNNKAFLGGEINWTDNGISIYVAAKKDPRPRNRSPRTWTADSFWPVGPVGKPTELHLMYPAMAMTYTKYPQACKALMAFMLEADNFNPWMKRTRLSHTVPDRL